MIDKRNENFITKQHFEIIGIIAQKWLCRTFLRKNHSQIYYISFKTAKGR